MVQLTHKHDVFNLPRLITPEEVSRLVGDDHDVFSLVAVTEAVTGVPIGVSGWLQSPEIAPEWLESLILNEGRHQIAWWTRKITLGDGHESTQSCARDLKRIRTRLSEARRVVRSQVEPRRTSSAESRALHRLKNAHAAEYEKMIDELFDSTGIAQMKAAAPKRLMEMSDEAFRDLVAADVQSKTEITGIDHIAVVGRWQKALTELAEIAFTHLGLEPNTFAIAAGFPIEDKDLPATPSRAEMDEWVRRMLFLAHLRTRLAERRLAKSLYNQRLSQEVYGVAEDRLRERHFAEYVTYRTVENDIPRREAKEDWESKRALTPERWPGWRQQIIRLGWKVLLCRSGSRVWLVGNRDGHLLTVTAKRHSTGAHSSGWTHTAFFFIEPSGLVWKASNFHEILKLAEATNRRNPVLSHAPEVSRGPVRVLEETQKRIVAPPVEAEEFSLPD